MNGMFNFLCKKLLNSFFQIITICSGGAFMKKQERKQSCAATSMSPVVRWVMEFLTWGYKISLNLSIKWICFKEIAIFCELTYLKFLKFEFQSFLCQSSLLNIFDRLLVEVVQQIAFSGDNCVPFAQIWDSFCLFRHVFILRQVRTCLLNQIISNCTIIFWVTGIDMIVSFKYLRAHFNLLINVVNFEHFENLENKVFWTFWESRKLSILSILRF